MSYYLAYVCLFYLNLHFRTSHRKLVKITLSTTDKTHSFGQTMVVSENGLKSSIKRRKNYFSILESGLYFR